MKKREDERLDALESRLGGGGERSSMEDGSELRRLSDVEASVERRLTQLHQQLRQHTDDSCQRLDKVRLCTLLACSLEVDWN